MRQLNDGVREITRWLAYGGNCARQGLEQIWSVAGMQPGSLQRFGFWTRCAWRGPGGLGAVIGRYFGRLEASMVFYPPRVRATIASDGGEIAVWPPSGILAISFFVFCPLLLLDLAS